MQSSYEDTVENGAREEKKRYSRGKKKISSTFGPLFPLFQEKKVKIIHFWIDRATLHFFLCCCVVLVLLFVAGKNQPTPENEETRTRGERREKKTLHDTIVVSHNRGTHLRATNSIRNIR